MSADPKTQRLLMVDDNEFVLSCFKDYLVSQGFEVDTALSAEEALAKLKQTAPDLIILDLAMPGMGGMGFLSKISGENSVLKYPVLVFTEKQEMEGFCRSVGVSGFLLKTGYGTPLLEAVRDILSRKDAEAEAARQEVLAEMDRVLLAEDDPVRADSIQRSLEHAGYTVDLARSGPEVLEKALAVTPDAIMIKEVLPGRNGSSLAAELHGSPRLQGVPVVLYDDTDTVAERVRRQGELPKGVREFVPSTERARLMRAIKAATGS